MSEEIFINCPYCGERLVIEPEPFDRPIEYVEDCHICCRPMVVKVIYLEKGSRVEVRRENG